VVYVRHHPCTFLNLLDISSLATSSSKVIKVRVVKWSLGYLMDFLERPPAFARETDTIKRDPA